MSQIDQAAVPVASQNEGGVYLFGKTRRLECNRGGSVASSHRGFSVVEMMIVVGIMTTMGMAFATLMVNSQSAMRNVEMTSRVNEFSNELMMTLRNKDSCQLNVDTSLNYFRSLDFNNGNPGAVSISVGKLQAGTAATQVTLAEEGKDIRGTLGLKVKNMAIQDLVDVSPAAAPKSQYVAKLNVAFERSGDIAGGANMRRTYSLLLATTSAGATSTIQSCNTGYNMSDGDLAIFCASLGGTFTPGTGGAQGMCSVGSPTANKMCADTTQVLQGFDASGNPICISNAPSGSCSTGYALSGYSSTGKPKCVSLTSGPAPASITPTAPTAPSVTCAINIVFIDIGTGISTQVNGSASNCPPNTAVTFERYSSGVLQASGNLGTTDSNGFWSASAVTDCGSVSAPCVTSITFHIGSYSQTGSYNLAPLSSPPPSTPTAGGPVSTNPKLLCTGADSIENTAISIYQDLLYRCRPATKLSTGPNVRLTESLFAHIPREFYPRGNYAVCPDYIHSSIQR